MRHVFLFPPCDCTGIPQGPLSHPLSSTLWCRQGAWAQEGKGSYLEGGLHLGLGFRAYQAQSLRIQWVVGNAQTCFYVFQ